MYDYAAKRQSSDSVKGKSIVMVLIRLLKRLRKTLFMQILSCLLYNLPQIVDNRGRYRWTPKYATHPDSPMRLHPPYILDLFAPRASHPPIPSLMQIYDRLLPSKHPIIGSPGPDQLP
jgi:hypothetical protein